MRNRECPPNAILRRTFLASSLTLLAGCSVFDPDAERTLFDEEIHLEPGEYRAVEFELRKERSVAFGFSSSQDTELDLLFVDQRNFEAYERGTDFAYRYTSGLGVSGGRSEDSAVPEGKYVVIFDNTGRGDASPKGETVSGRGWVVHQPSN